MAGFRLLFKRGTDAERRQYVAADGEPIWTTDLKELWVGDGVNAGGRKVAGSTGGGPVAWADITDKPTAFPPTAHGHPLEQITQSGATIGQVPAWNGTAWVATTLTLSGTVTWADIAGKPSTFAPSAHASSHGAGGGDPIAIDQSQVAGLVAGLAGKIAATEKAAANGVATLGSDGKIPTSQLPALAVTETFVVASESAMLALTAERGDVAIRTDLTKSFILMAEPASTLANWQEILSAGSGGVLSVNGQTGVVTLTLAGLGGQASDADLTALAALTGTGIAKRTGADTWALAPTLGTADIADDAVTADKIADGAVGAAAVSPTVVSGQTAMTNAAIDDELLIRSAADGTLRKIKVSDLLNGTSFSFLLTFTLPVTYLTAGVVTQTLV